MGCAASSSVQSSAASLPHSSHPQTPFRSHSLRTVKVTPKHSKVNISTEGGNTTAQNSSSNNGIAFEITLDDSRTKRELPKRLSRLEPIDGPKLTAEELEEKMRLAERKRNNELEHRAKTASASRRLSKRKRELMVAQEFEQQQSQAQELEKKLQAAERQRELKLQLKLERQHIKEERARMARARKQEMLNSEIIDFDVEQDENFNNDDVDSWLDGSNNGTNTVDTGFSSAGSERIYSGRESPKKRYNPHSVSRSNYLNSASTVDSCDILHYKQNSKAQLQVKDTQQETTRDDFFD